MGLPGVLYYEPAYAAELECILCWGLQQLTDRQHGQSVYLRLSTRPITQAVRHSTPEWRRQVLAGGYWLRDGPVVTPVEPGGSMPSRAAENLFWLGRYAERAESIARLARVICLRLASVGELAARVSPLQGRSACGWHLSIHRDAKPQAMPPKQPMRCCARRS